METPTFDKFLAELKAWAMDTSDRTQDKLPPLPVQKLQPVAVALQSLQGLQGLTPSSFEEHVLKIIKDFKSTVSEGLEESERREALLRYQIDVTPLIPQAYTTWLDPLRMLLEMLFIGEARPPTETDGFVQLKRELLEWSEKLIAWRKRLLYRSADTCEIQPLDLYQTLKNPVRALMDPIVAERMEPLREAVDLLKSTLDAFTVGPLQVARKQNLISILLRHPLYMIGGLDLEDWLDEIILANTRGFGDGVKTPGMRSDSDQIIRPLLEKMADPTIVDILREAVDKYLQTPRAKDDASQLRPSTLSLYQLIRLLFIPAHNVSPSVEKVEQVATRIAVNDLDERQIRAWRAKRAARNVVPAGPPRRSSEKRPRAKVTVIGGGVAGMSAAHELIERGFDVQVVEKARDVTPYGPKLGLGGVARTQWAVVGNGDEHSDTIMPAWPVEWTCARSLRFKSEGTDPLAPDDRVAFIISCLDLLSEMLQTWDGKSVAPPVRIEIRGHACGLCERGHEDDLSEQRARYCWAMLSALARPYKETEAYKQVMSAALIRCGNRLPRVIDFHEHDPKHCVNRRVEILVTPLEDQGACFVPGEHGYRFFPSFYRHLRDTMRRTPLYDAHGRETERTAHDNLVPTFTQVFASPGRSVEFSRARPRSLEAFRRELRRALVDLKFERRDLHRFGARILRYLSTGRARREATYEQLSWWEYLTLKEVLADHHDDPKAPRYQFSAEFERQLKAAPQALVAMDAEYCDARTQGNIVVQLLLDQFLGNDTTDSTLNGPTSEAWFDHWRRHLQAMGVRFFEGELYGFGFQSPENKELVARWASGRYGVRLPLPPHGTDYAYDQMVDYYVLAVDVVSAEHVTRTLLPYNAAHSSGGEPLAGENAGGVIYDLKGYTTYIPSRRDIRLEHAKRDSSRNPILRRDEDRTERVTSSWRPFYERYEDLALWEEHPSWVIRRTGRERDSQRPVYGRNPTDRLQTFSGVQFYFRDDFQIARGHAYFQDTAWGLSAISQMQFWLNTQKYRHEGVRGILSVDIGSFYAPSGYLRLPAHQVGSKNALAKEVWRQALQSLRRSHEDRLPQDQVTLPLPQPFAYHVDNWLEFEAEQTNTTGRRRRGVSTSTPFLVNNAGDWVYRPGAEPWDPAYLRAALRREDTPHVWQASHGGYQVHYDKLVFAGVYTKTFTRMTTMEAANESARHAVNAILDHVNSPSGRARLLGRVMQHKGIAAFEEAKKKSLKDATEEVGNPADSDRISKRAGELFPGIHEKELGLQLGNLSQIDTALISGDYCKIWDPERHELEELEFLRRVDDMLFEAGKPHMFDILGVDELVDRASPASDPLEALLMAVGTTVQRDWDLGSIKDGGGLKLLRDLGEQLRKSFADLRAPEP